MLRDMPKNEGGRPEKPPTEIEGVSDDPATYKDLGINYKDASVWQFMADNE